MIPRNPVPIGALLPAVLRVASRLASEAARAAVSNLTLPDLCRESPELQQWLQIGFGSSSGQSSLGGQQNPKVFSASRRDDEAKEVGLGQEVMMLVRT